MKITISLLFTILILPQFAFSRITQGVQSYCQSLNIASPEDFNDCMKFSQICSFQMYSFVNSACGVDGDMERQITQTGTSASNVVQGTAGYHNNAAVGMAACEQAQAQRQTQQLRCRQMVEFCTTGNNPNSSSNGLPEVFYATVTTKSGSQVKITCNNYPDSVCDKGQENLNHRIPAAIAGEKQLCDQVKNISNATETLPEESSPGYTSDEIVCKLLPTAEGCEGE